MRVQNMNITYVHRHRNNFTLLFGICTYFSAHKIYSHYCNNIIIKVIPIYSLNAQLLCAVKRFRY